MSNKNNIVPFRAKEDKNRGRRRPINWNRISGWNCIIGIMTMIITVAIGTHIIKERADYESIIIAILVAEMVVFSGVPIAYVVGRISNWLKGDHG